MLYVRFDGDIPVEAHNGPPIPLVQAAVMLGMRVPRIWQNRCDWTSLERVERIARLLTITTGKRYLGVDEGEHVYPRFDIIEAFKIGDPVSYAFNGDYYPDGYITEITPTFRITTDTRNHYRRLKNTSRWYQSVHRTDWRHSSKSGKTWLLFPGHISVRNPNF